MMPNTDSDYKQLLSQLIKKQMLILGSEITLSKVRNVTGVTVDINGDVQKIEGDPQALLQSLINQFVELSGLIVKKTMESILTSYPAMAGMSVTGAFVGSATAEPTTQAQNVQTPVFKTQTAVSQGFADMPTQEVAVSPPAPPKPAEPPTFSSNEMDDLNKALEQLSKTPLSTEQVQN